MPVSYQQIVDTILLESGQYIADLDATLLNKPKIELMIQRELGQYSRYQPNRVHQFAELWNGKVFSVEVDGCVPDAIVSVKTDRFNTIGFSITPLPGPVHNYYWRYDKPTLYFRYPDGIYEYSYITSHTYDPVLSQVASLDLSSRFVTLVVARFMIIVGRSRNAFTIEEVKIATSASDMISEGKELYKETLDAIQQNSSFWLSVLV